MLKFTILVEINDNQIDSKTVTFNENEVPIDDFMQAVGDAFEEVDYITD